jgi:hypothetical protein
MHPEEMAVSRMLHVVLSPPFGGEVEGKLKGAILWVSENGCFVEAPVPARRDAKLDVCRGSR